MRIRCGCCSRFASVARDVPTKSGLMLGLGETDAEIVEVMHDLRRHGVEMLTVGQYLQPRPGNLPVLRYVAPGTVRRAGRAGPRDGIHARRLRAARALELPRRPAGERGRLLIQAIHTPRRHPWTIRLHPSRSTSRCTSRSSRPSSSACCSGHFYPHTGEAMKPLGDGFIKLIKMIIAPIIFCTVVVGIAGMEDMKKVGKTGGLALLYFEIVSSIALVVGLVIINIVQPGAGMNIDPASLDTKGIAAYTGPGKMQGTDRLPAQRHPEHRGRRLRQGRDPAGAAVRGDVRLRAAQVRRPRHAGVRLHREVLARAVRRSSATS